MRAPDRVKRSPIALVGLIAVACGSSPPPPPFARDDVCIPAATVLAKGQALRQQGFLGRALPIIEASDRDCSSDESRWAIAAVLADLGLTDQARDAVSRYVNQGGDAARGRELESRLARQPDPARRASQAERETARAAYARGAAARVAGHVDAAISEFETSYAAWPHPLALVQIGLTKKQAGDVVGAQIMYARALATAERVAGTAARPVFMQLRLDPLVVAVHPGGATTAVLSRGGEVTLWARSTGRVVRAMHHANADHLVFSPSGNALATAGPTARGGLVRVWDAETGSVLRSLRVAGAPTDVAFDDDGRHVVVAHAQRVEVFDVLSGRQSRVLDVRSDSPRAALSSGSIIVADGADVEIYDRGTGAQLHSLRGVGVSLDVVARSSETGLIAVGDSLGGVVVIDGAAGTEIARHSDHRAPIEAIAFRRGGTHVVSLDASGLMYVLALNAGDSFTIRLTGSTPMALSADATLGLTSRHGEQEIVDLWNLSAGRAERAFAGSGERLTAMAVGAVDGAPRYLAVATERGPIHLWDLTKGTFARLTGHEGAVSCLTFTTDAALMASGGVDGTVRVWEMRTQQQLAELDATGAVTAVGFSPSGREVGGRYPSGPRAWEVMTERATDPTAIALKEPRSRAERAGLVAEPSAAGGASLGWKGKPPFAEVLATRAGDWAILGADGRVEGTDNAQGLVYWIVGDVQLPGFVGWQRQRTDAVLPLLVQRPGQVDVEREGAEEDHTEPR